MGVVIIMVNVPRDAYVCGVGVCMAFKVDKSRKKEV